jgi:hypothetical protein
MMTTEFGAITSLARPPAGLVVYGPAAYVSLHMSHEIFA